MQPFSRQLSPGRKPVIKSVPKKRPQNITQQSVNPIIQSQPQLENPKPEIKVKIPNYKTKAVLQANLTEHNSKIESLRQLKVQIQKWKAKQEKQKNQEQPRPRREKPRPVTVQQVVPPAPRQKQRLIQRPAPRQVPVPIRQEPLRNSAPIEIPKEIMPENLPEDILQSYQAYVKKHIAYCQNMNQENKAIVLAPLQAMETPLEVQKHLNSTIEDTINQRAPSFNLKSSSPLKKAPKELITPQPVNTHSKDDIDSESISDLNQRPMKHFDKPLGPLNTQITVSHLNKSNEGDGGGSVHSAKQGFVKSKSKFAQLLEDKKEDQHSLSIAYARQLSQSAMKKAQELKEEFSEAVSNINIGEEQIKEMSSKIQQRIDMQKQERLRRQNSGATPYSKQNSQLLMKTSEKPPLQRSQTNAERTRMREFMVDLE